MFKGAKRALPEYYDGKLFIYEWMRGWIMAVTMDKEGNLVSMEPFMPSYKYSNPMDMQFGPEGDLYMLEYGTGWFQQNDNARLVKIEYNGGNRKPVVMASVDKKAGATPLKVNLSANGTKDYDHDKLTYEWIVSSEGGSTQSFTTPDPAVTLKEPGVYKATLTVTDAQGEKNSEFLEIRAGNEPPVLTFDITDGNKTFFFPGKPFQYNVNVEDKEDGTLANGAIKPEQVAVTIDYLPEGFDEAAIALGHRTADAAAQVSAGENLINDSDCKACHSLDKKSVGPSFTQISEKYKGDRGAPDRLAQKIIAGGSGVWGEVAMSAHPQLPLEDAKEMVTYILGLANADTQAKSLPAKGTYTPTLPTDDKMQGAFVFERLIRIKVQMV